MDTSKLKVFTRKLGVLKDFMPLLISLIIIAAAAIILVLTPLLMGSNLKSEIESKSLSSGKSLSGMRNVPAKDQWLEEKKYQDHLAEDANKVARLFTGSSKRALLSYRIFPQPKDSSQFIFERFVKNYREGIEDQLRQIRAGDCPTQAELSQLISTRSGSVRGAGSYYSPSAGQPGADKKIEDALCLDRARNASVYASPLDFTGYKLNFGEALNVQIMVDDCWFRQLGYWITEDVIQTVGALNKGSVNVNKSLIKRIVNVSFNRQPQPYRNISQMRLITDVPDLMSEPWPFYVLKEGDGFTETFTGRFSNAEYDVVQFYVMGIVKSDQVFPFMQELCSSKEHTFNGFSGQEPAQKFHHNQITIIESNIRPVIRENGSHRFYRYGEDAVVELSLVCEYLFDLKGYSAVKPQSVTDAQAAGNTGAEAL
ncbi:MAG: hypothetical protein E4H16_01975 [Candidatus Atribacteria bacterium]|nr:MAG: hypothetical protein E4H16_01975 [Candidatus Atribacteria bacterium]